MTEFGSFASIPGDEPFPGVRRHAFSTGKATVTSYVFDPGSAFPLHEHREEQITLVEEGEATFTVDGESHELRAGDWSVVAGDVAHGLVAGPSGARILAILVPPRRSPDAFELA